MENRLTIKQFLRAFDCVCSSGEKQGHKYQLNGVCAWHDFEGYTCWLSYEDVIVTLMFHGSLKIDYDNQANYSEFLNRCLVLTASKTVQ